MNIEINLNDYVSVTLSEEGADVFNRYFEEVPAKRRPAKVEEGCEMEGPLWEMFQIFGEHVGLGKHLPFKVGKIILLRE